MRETFMPGSFFSTVARAQSKTDTLTKSSRKIENTSTANENTTNTIQFAKFDIPELISTPKLGKGATLVLSRKKSSFATPKHGKRVAELTNVVA
jgi:hypothetical protein